MCNDARGLTVAEPHAVSDAEREPDTKRQPTANTHSAAQSECLSRANVERQ